MEQKISDLNCYFAQQIAMCGQRGQALQADDRADEAIFEKVKANVYDIFRTVFSVAVQTCKEDPDAVQRFFALRLEQIPTSWAAALEEAKKHDDAVKMRLEQIKLDTVGAIRENFVKIWEAAA